jgi:cytochrome c oxidase subunit 4
LGEHRVSEHIVSPRVYAVIFLSLMVGTAITVWAAFQNFGKFNIVIALVIATIKATLVVLYFMHARYSPKRTQLVIVCSVFWLAIMLVLTLADYDTRSHELQPGVSRLTPLVQAQSFQA